MAASCWPDARTRQLRTSGSPGSRLYKGEKLDAAAHRVADEGLGIDIEIVDRLGVYEHVWESSAVAGVPTRHTVNIVFHVRPQDSSPEIRLDEQHSDYRFVSAIEPQFHEYVRTYLADSGLLD